MLQRWLLPGLQLWRSVIPKSFLLGIAAMALTLLIRLYQDMYLNGDPFLPIENVKDNNMYMVYNYALGILIVFRNYNAYGRWWDGAQRLRQATHHMLEAYVQAISATEGSDVDEDKCDEFRHMACTLSSLLICSGLQYVAVRTDERNWELLDLSLLDGRSIKILQKLEKDAKGRMLLTRQWIMNLLHTAIKQGIMCAPPPILATIFQDLGNSILHFENLATISSTPLPAPYALMIDILLCTHFIYTSIILAVVVPNYIWGAASTFITVFCLWCINLIAVEIEHPFGDDINDLPVHELQEECNEVLLTGVAKDGRHLPCKKKGASIDVFKVRATSSRRFSQSVYDPETRSSDSLMPLDATDGNQEVYVSQGHPPVENWPHGFHDVWHGHGCGHERREPGSGRRDGAAPDGGGASA